MSGKRSCGTSMLFLSNPSWWWPPTARCCWPPLQAFGVERGKAYQPLPKWRRKAYRPSCLDLVTLLRKEMVEHPELIKHLHVKPSDRGLTEAAAA